MECRASPSRLMTAIDTLLPLGVLLSCLEAYIPDKHDLSPNFDQSKLQFSQLDTIEETTVQLEDFEQDFEFVSINDVPPPSPPPSPRDNNFSKFFNTFVNIKRRLIGINSKSFNPFNNCSYI